MTLPVVLDACVLLPYQLCDLLLRLAEAELYQPMWSEEILSEVHRNLETTFKKTEAQANKRVEAMRETFPQALREGFEPLIPTMTNHPRDRHVLAAAVGGRAHLIVTANLSDFPERSLSPFGIEAMHPDEFLQDLLDVDPVAVRWCLLKQRVAYTKPSFTRDEFYAGLARTVPKFSQRAAALDIGT